MGNTGSVLLLMSGGISNPKIPISEAELMRQYCIENGIYKDNIIVEDNSLDTIGNAFFTRKIIDAIPNISDIYVISSCYHMNRAKYIFINCYGEHGYNLNFNYCFF